VGLVFLPAFRGKLVYGQGGESFSNIEFRWHFTFPGESESRPQVVGPFSASPPADLLLGHYQIQGAPPSASPSVDVAVVFCLLPAVFFRQSQIEM